jgi:hypothetical protein
MTKIQKDYFGKELQGFFSQNANEILNEIFCNFF